MRLCGMPGAYVVPDPENDRRGEANHLTPYRTLGIVVTRRMTARFR